MLKGWRDWGEWGLALEEFIGGMEQGFEGRECSGRGWTAGVSLTDKTGLCVPAVGLSGRVEIASLLDVEGSLVIPARLNTVSQHS